MTHRVFGQLDQREERNKRFQSWLNCRQVRPDGSEQLPDRVTDVPQTVSLIRQLLLTAENVQIDVTEGGDTVSAIRSLLSAEENRRVKISA